MKKLLLFLALIPAALFCAAQRSPAAASKQKVTASVPAKRLNPQPLPPAPSVNKKAAKKLNPQPLPPDDRRKIVRSPAFKKQ